MLNDLLLNSVNPAPETQEGGRVSSALRKLLLQPCGCRWGTGNGRGGGGGPVWKFGGLERSLAGSHGKNVQGGGDFSTYRKKMVLYIFGCLRVFGRNLWRNIWSILYSFIPPPPRDPGIYLEIQRGVPDILLLGVRGVVLYSTLVFQEAGCFKKMTTNPLPPPPAGI